MTDQPQSPDASDADPSDAKKPTNQEPNPSRSHDFEASNVASSGENRGDLPNGSDQVTVDPSKSLPEPAVARLSLYFRELHRLQDAGTLSINSRELGRLVNVSPAVVRRDLSALGTIGRRGVGYGVPMLIEAIGGVLGSGFEWRVVLVGAGSLGDALLRYRGFDRLGFRLVAAFDSDPAKVGTEIGGLKVTDADRMDSLIRELKPHLAILAVPAEHASEVAARLVGGGISGILNFAPTILKLSPGIAVANVDLASELQRLAFSVQNAR